MQTQIRIYFEVHAYTAQIQIQTQMHISDSEDPPDKYHCSEDIHLTIQIQKIQVNIKIQEIQI